MTIKQNDGWDDDSNEVLSNWVKFNVPLKDKIFGTLIARRQVESTYKPGEMEEVYEIKADMGSFHDADEKTKKVIEPAITINAGEVWNIGGKKSINAQMRNVKIGQKVGFKFIDTKPSKTTGWADAKSIKVYAPKNDDGSVKMDEEWLEEHNSAEPTEA